MTLHTGPNCGISTTGAFSGKVATSNCDVNAKGQAQNAGCSIDTADDTSYGDGFNDGNGGVYATEWTSDSISIYYFPRSSIPSDITSGSPDPSGWGSPLSQFKGSCDISNIFKDQQIVFDVTFCGDWAGNVWSSDATCSAKASTCQSYVQNNPSAFADSYWEVNSLKVYQSGGSGGSSQSQPQPVQSSTAQPIPVTTLQTSTRAAPSTTSEPTPLMFSSFGSTPSPATSSQPAPVSSSESVYLTTSSLPSSQPLFSLQTSSSLSVSAPRPPISSGFIGSSSHRPTTIVTVTTKTAVVMADADKLHHQTPLADVARLTRTRVATTTLYQDGLLG